MLKELVIKAAEQSQETRASRGWRPSPSRAGLERCIRQSVYQGLQFPAENKMSGRGVIVLDDSSWHEELTLDWLRTIPSIKVHSEQMKVENCMEINGYPVFGYIDFIITDLENKDYLVDHKAINHFTFQRYESGAELPYDYFCQLCLYLKGLLKINPEMDLMAILFVKNKNTSAYMEFMCRYDPKADMAVISLGGKEVAHYSNILSKVKERFLQIENHVKEKTLPKRQYTPDHWRCQYCAYRDVCWEGYLDEFGEIKADSVIQDDELLMKATRYHEIGQLIKPLESEKDTLKEALKNYFRDKKLAGVVQVGEYKVNFKVQERSYLDKKMIPENIVEEATCTKIQEEVRVTKPKPKKPKGKDRK